MLLVKRESPIDEEQTVDSVGENPSGRGHMRTINALALTAVFGFLTSLAQAAGLPLVISATVDYSHNTLTISGQNFSSNPSVTLDALSFRAQSPSSSGQIVRSTTDWSSHAGCG
jgi:hypothetical protein